MGWLIRQIDDKMCQRATRKIFVALIASLVFSVTALAQTTITPDNNTATTLSTTGNTTDINTTTISGTAAYNSFSAFNVGQGDVVNLYLPSGTDTLLNLVNAQTMNVDGILNSIENGKVGGNVFFADPFGIVVGSTGVVNVGSFTALTPTTDFMNSFFDSPGNPNAAEANAILTGAAPISPDGLISIKGTINALTDITLSGGLVSNSGIIQSGATFTGTSAADFSDVVNSNGIQNGTSIAVQNGDIVIQAAGDVENAGSIATNGGNNLNAGNINIQAGGNLTLDSGSLISASGSGQSSNGGNINMMAAGNGSFSSGAVVAANGGDVSGNGGPIEFSAQGTVNLAGGTFEAGAVDGTGGTATVDPTDLIISGNNASTDGKTNLNYTADNSITVDSNAVISTRQISAADLTTGDFLNAVSTGDSANITLTAPHITVDDGAEILANVDSGSIYTPGSITMTADNSTGSTQPTGNASITIGSATILGGDIKLAAKQSVSDLYFFAPTITANAKISIGNATITGTTVTIQANAEADADKTPSQVANEILGNFSVGDFVGSYGPVSWKAAKAASSISIGDSGSSGTATITSSGDMSVNSVAGATSVSSVIGSSGFAYGSSKSSASTSVAGNATLSASGALDIKSTSNNTLNVKESTTTDSAGVIAIAYGATNSSSDTEIDGTVSGGTVNISATNNNNFETQAIAKPFTLDPKNAPTYGGGLGVALGSYQSTATTNVPGSVTSTLGDATISSNSTDQQDAVFSSSAVNTDGGLGGTFADTQNLVQNIGGFLNQGKFLPNSATQEGQVGKFGFTAAVTYVVGSNSATTTVTGAVNAQGNANITGDATDAPQAAALGSVSGQKVDFGGGVSVADFSNTADALVKGGAQVNSVAGSISITSNATMANPAENRVDLIQSAQDFSNVAGGFSSFLGDIGQLVSIVGNPGEFTTTFVNAGLATQAAANAQQGSNFGLAVSASVLTLTNKSTASVTGAGTSVLAGYDSGGDSSTISDGNVNIEADSNLTSFNLAGTSFSIGQLASKNPNPGVESGTSLGGSANIVMITNHSTAKIGDGTTVKALTQVDDNKGQVSVTSNTQTLEAALAQAGAKAQNFGVSGTFDYLDLNDSSKAYIQSNATVSATNNVDVSATNDLLDIAVGGALGFGGSKQIDVAVNWNNLSQTTLAYIGDPSNSRTTICKDCGVTAGGAVNVKANSSEDLFAITMAAAASGDPPPTPPNEFTWEDPPEGAGNGAGGGGYGFGISGEIAINLAGTATSPGIVTKAYINNGANVTATSGDINVQANDSSQFVNAALAGSLITGESVDSGVALAGAYDQNIINKDVEAFTENSTLSGGGLDINATGENNLYAVSIGGAVDNLDSGVALAGAANNDQIYNTVTANLGEGTVATGILGDGVTVNAQEGADTVASAVGGFAGGGSGGVGAAVDVGKYNNTVTANIGAKVNTTGNIQVKSLTNVQYIPVAVSFAGSQDFGAAGSFAVETINDTTSSSVGGTVTSGQNLLVGSKDSSSAAIVAGGVGISGTVGVDVAAIVPDFTRDTTASIAAAAAVSAAGSGAASISYDNKKDVGILLDASTSGDLTDIVVGGAGSKAVALGGSLIINKVGSKSLNDTTSATIGKNATVNGDNSDAATSQSVTLLATDSSNILDVAGELGASGKVGVGIGYDQITPEWDVSTSIGTGSTVNAASNVILDSTLKNSIKSYAIDGDATLGQISASVTGATSVIKETSNVDSTVNGTVSAGGSVEVAADRNTSSLDALDGNAAVAISYGAGVGVSLADITTNDTVDASIGGTGDVTALGKKSLQLPDGTIDSSSGQPGTSSFRGVSVTAMSFLSSNPITAGVAGSAIAGAQGSVLKDSYTETTKAHVDSGAKVNQTNDTKPNSSQSVQVLASDETNVDSTAGGLSLGALALTASVDNETLNRTVDAYITGANVDAADNVLVVGSMFGTINSASAAGNLGAFTGAGAVSNITETTDTEAYVNAGSVVTANGNVEILANRNTSLTTKDGSGTGGAAGVNASESTVNKSDTVKAYIDGATTSVSAFGQDTYSGLSVPEDSSGSLITGIVSGLTVAATAKENLNTSAIGASVLLAGGATGSKTVNTISENTSAKVEGGATINGDNTNAGLVQGVNVLASDTTTLTNADGAYGTSFVGVGIGAGVDTANIQKTTVAGIDNGSKVNATGAVNVDALSKETLKTHVAAVGGSVAAGGAGTNANYSTHPIKTTTTAYVGSCTSSSKCDNGATVKSNGLGVDANDNMTLNVTTGELSAGLGAAVGAGELNVTVDANTSAYIGALSSITVNPDGVDVNSTFTDSLTGTARAGSGSALVSDEMAHSSITDNSNNTAFIASKATVDSYGGGSINVTANTTRHLSATTKGLSVALGVGLGGTTAHTTTSGVTEAYLGDNVNIQTNYLNVDAIDNSSATSSTTALAAGIVAGATNDSNAYVGDSSYAYIGNQANITAYGVLTVEAASTYQVNATSSGNAYGVGTGGPDTAEATADPATYAFIGDNESITSPNGSINVDAYNGYNPASSDGGDVTASATTTVGALGGGVGSKATGTAEPNVQAYIGDASNSGSSTITAKNKLTIKTVSDPTVKSTADATVYALGVNASVKATSTIINDNIASTGSNTTLNAKTVTISSSSNPNDQSTAKGGYGGLFYAGAGDTATTNLTDYTEAVVGQGASITAEGTLLVQSAENDIGSATSTNDSDGLVAIPVTTANINDVSVANTYVDSKAKLTGDTVNLNAKVTGINLKTNSIAGSDAGYSSATAYTTIDALVEPTLTVYGGATITGNNINVTASISTVDSETNATANTKGFTGTATATPLNILLLQPTVNADLGSTFNTNNLTVNSDLPASPIYDNGETVNNQTVTGVVDTFFTNLGNTVVDGVTDFGNTVSSGFQSFGNSIKSVFDPPPTNMTWNNTINFNGTVGESGGGSAVLTIGSDGTVTQDTNVPAPTTDTANNQIIVPNIVNNVQTSVNFNVAGGTMSGNVTIDRASDLSSVDITNNSNYDLVINGIQPYFTNNNQPTWNVTAATDNSHVTVVANVIQTPITIETTQSGSNLIFAGFIDNGVGSLTASSLAGNITGTSGSILKDNFTDLEAPSGSIGSAANPINIQMSYDLGNSQGPVTPVLNATAGNDLYANVDAVNDVVTTPSSTPNIPADISLIHAGGSIDLNLQPGQVFVSQPTTSSSGCVSVCFSNSTVAANAVYYLSNPVSNGDTTVNVTDSVLNLNGPLTAGGAANFTVTDGSLYSLGSAQVIQADGISLNVSDGQIGTSTNPVNIDLTGGKVGATAHGDVNLNETAGSLNVGSITSDTGNVNLTAPKGDVNLGTISSTFGDTTIAASGSILDPPSDETNITAVNVNLTAQTGSIGTETDPISIDSSNDSPGQLTAWANQDVWITEVNGDLNVNTVTSALDNVNLTALAGNVNLGTVDATQGTATINASGSILDTFDPGVGNANINADDVDLTATNGSIGAKGNALQIDSTGTVGGSAAGDIYLNETAGSLNVGSITSYAGNVNLTAPTGDVNLGTISSTFGDTTITASGSILDPPSDETNITAVNVNLTATNGSIGTEADPITIDSSNNSPGQLTASANKDVWITEVNGDLNVNTVTSALDNVNLTTLAGNVNLGTVDATQGTATITASGSILDGDAAQGTSDINANNINLTATAGTIGTVANPLQIDSSYSAAGLVNGLALGDVNLNETAGSLNVGTITSSGGDVNLTVPDGDANLGTVNSTAGTTTITASGSILNATDSTSANISAENINLTATTGSIGTSGTMLTINSSDASPGVVNALADLGVYLDQLSGPLNVDSIESQTGDIVILSDGSILNAGSPDSYTPGVNLTGNNITLTSTNGSIGVEGNRLVIDNRNPGTITGGMADGSNYLDMTAEGDIYVNEVGGNLLSHSISSAAGDIDLLASNGNGNLDQVIGNQNVTVDVTGSLLNINNITGSTPTAQKAASPNNVSLTVQTAGGTLNVNHMDVFQSVTTRADNTTLADVVHTNLANPTLDTDVQANALHFDDQAAAGGIANNIDINVSPCAACTTAPAVIFDNYLTQTGTVNASVEWLEFINAVVGTSGDFQNNWVNISLTNMYSSPHKADASWYLFMIGNNFSAQDAFPIEHEDFTFLQIGLVPTYAQPIGTILGDITAPYGFDP